METSRFLFPDEQSVTGKRITRPAKSPLQNLRARLWTLNLMYCLGASIDELNLQLVLPPGSRPFVLHKEPRPLLKLTKRDRVFEGPLERGADPTGLYFGTDDDRYRLAERVESHVPGTREWLMEPLRPYLDAELPPVDYALQTIESITQARGMRRLGTNSVEFGAQQHLGTIQQLANAQLGTLAELSSPLHLPLLIALYHERCWWNPSSGEANRLRRSVEAAFDKLAGHPMLLLHPAGQAALDELAAARSDLLWRIPKLGPRSPRPSDMCPLPAALPTLFCRNFDAFVDADYCASLGLAVPERHFCYPRRTQFSDQDYPSKGQCNEAFLELLRHANIGDMCVPLSFGSRVEFKHLLERFTREAL